ncbi:hypothetical protein SAMN06298216_3161 [Spirosomataceae bacterium TFI 002]|nr:hypothetical protein SAMN06298216_3161 [Spirosomataceae bacterium TFI 002]
MENTLSVVLTLLLITTTSFCQKTVITVDFSSVDFEDMDKQEVYVSNGKVLNNIEEVESHSIEVEGLPTYFDLLTRNKKKLKFIKRIWVEQAQITLKGSISNIDIVPLSSIQASVDEHYSILDDGKSIDPDLRSTRPYLANLANKTQFYTSEYICETISQLPDSLNDFWAIKLLNEYLENIDEIGFDTSTKKLTSFSAINRENKEQKVTMTTGKYLLLDFSGPGCIPCLKDIDKLVAINTKYAGKLEIAVLWQGLTYEQWLAYMPQFLSKITYTNLLNSDGSIFKKMDVTVAPTYMLFNPDGILQKTWKGRLTKELSKYLN